LKASADKRNRGCKAPERRLEVILGKIRTNDLAFRYEETVALIPVTGEKRRWRWKNWRLLSEVRVPERIIRWSSGQDWRSRCASIDPWTL
jgi:hypothetical protein